MCTYSFFIILTHCCLSENAVCEGLKVILTCVAFAYIPFFFRHEQSSSLLSCAFSSPVVGSPLNGINSSYVLFELRLWGYFAFGTAMYGIMALRVHALYRHSRKILAFLIVCIVVKKSIQATVYAVVIGPSSGDKEDVDAGVFNCGMSSISVTGIILSSLPAFSFDFVLFVLMLRQFVHHALEMRRLFGRWKTSELMRIMTRDMIVFIFLI
ncbi:hypothetical protein F5I97DRAFT_1144461 [Phlebopus sp. FC_14]|nr:hypothetical protein F5I97DRAFT_1144461 [Phlebopus sp. FC_14]